MITKKLDVSKKNIEIAGKIIKGGGLVAFPTETVYGLGADAMNPDAVAKIYKAKGRPSDNPMIIHISHMDELNLLSEDVNDMARLLMKTFWPGPITFVVLKKENVPGITTGGMETVAVRMPSDETARMLIRAAGVPIAAPSANISGSPSPTNAYDVLEDMDGRIDAILMGESCKVGIESTVLDVTGEEPIILRPGYITKEDIDLVLGIKAQFDEALFKNPLNDDSFKPKSPGMKYKHYSPKADLKIVEGEGEDLKEKIEKIRNLYIKEGKNVEVLFYEDNKKAAQNFFSDLRKLDRKGVDVIITAALKQEGLGFSVMNRILKSAGYEVVDYKEDWDDCNSQ